MFQISIQCRKYHFCRHIGNKESFQQSNFDTTRYLRFSNFATENSVTNSSVNGIQRSKKLIITVREHRARAVKSDHKGERARAHDARQWTIPIDACGPRCKLCALRALIAILYLRLVKSRRYHDIILRVFFFCARSSSSRERRASPPSTVDSTVVFYSFYHDESAALISDTHLVFGCVNLSAR